MTKQTCDTCGTELILDGCSECGAPICCPVCCRETTLESEIERLKEENLRLHAVRDAAEPFMADPPIGVGDHVPCQQYTTAGDCRALAAAMQRLDK